MEGFLQRRRSPQATQTLIKEALLCQLSHTVKELQLLQSQGHHTESHRAGEAVHSFISVLEAIFLHGLKRSLLRKAFKSVSGMEETRPQPSFWAVVKGYTHKHVLESVAGLTQVSSDVGRSRVWIRLAVNQTELTSYLLAMDKDRRGVNGGYTSSAFLRDRDTSEMARRLLEGILTVHFDLPVNSSILNVWSNEALMLSGTWAPALKTPVASAMDVAEGLEDEDDDASSVRTASSVTTLSTILALDETQALRMILETPARGVVDEAGGSEELDVSSPEPFMPQEGESEDEVEDKLEREQVETTPSRQSRQSRQNTQDTQSKQREAKPQIEIKQFKELRTYSSLLESYGSPPKHNIEYRDVVRASPEPVEDSSPEDYELLSDAPDVEWDALLFQIPRELGLRGQNYSCWSCQLSIGLHFGEARLCHFTGRHFCSNCHLNEMAAIPSRVLFNWDHRKHPVSTQAAIYLQENTEKPNINIKSLNPRLYHAVDELRDLRTLRFQLNLLRAYLDTCRGAFILELQKRLWPREYLYQHVHTYSIGDLVKVPGGGLAAELSAAVALVRGHVTGCWLCSQKGFICEFCRNPKVIYPFDCNTTYRCSKCHAVYHEPCLSGKACPRCKRRQSRALLTRTDSLNSE